MESQFTHGALFLVKLNRQYDRETMILDKNIWLRPIPYSLLIRAFLKKKTSGAWRLLYLPQGGNARLLHHRNDIERNGESLSIGDYEFQLQSICHYHFIEWVWQSLVSGSFFPWRRIKNKNLLDKIAVL